MAFVAHLKKEHNSVRIRLCGRWKTFSKTKTDGYMFTRTEFEELTKHGLTKYFNFVKQEDETPKPEDFVKTDTKVKTVVEADSIEPEDDTPTMPPDNNESKDKKNKPTKRT